MTDLGDGTDLRTLMERTMGRLDAPGHLGGTAVCRGRRLRRQRRVLFAGTGAAGVVVAGALVVATLGGPGSTGSVPDFAGDPAGSPSPGPTNPPDDSTRRPVEGWWNIPATELLDKLETALPAGVEVVDAELAPADRGPGDPDVSEGSLGATLGSSAGPGGFEIILYPPETTEEPSAVTTTDAAGNLVTSMHADGVSYHQRSSCPGNLTAYDDCTELVGPDGGHLGRTSVSTPGEITIHETVLRGPHGGLLYFATTNSTDEKWGSDSPASATTPPLTLDQVRTLAESPTWTDWAP